MDNLHQQTACSGGAEAVLSLQPSSSISLTYHSLFGPHRDLMLLELDNRLLPDILHKRVTLRGQPDEDAVLCNSSKTYAVKFVGTSNSMLLIPPSDDVSRSCINKDDGSMVVASVLKVAPGCMELVEVSPKLDELKLLLSQNPYSFGEASEMDTSEEREKTRLGLYRWEDLVERIQGSDEELKMGLQSLSAVEIDGYWRILDDGYMHAILSMLLHNVILNDWSVNALDEDEVLGVLEADGFPRNIAKRCLQAYCSKVDDEGVCVSRQWKLEERRVCVCLAREILKGGKMKLEIFMEKWTRKLPDGMRPSFEMLEGEVLTEKLGIETWLYSFSVTSLPSTPAERFAILFQQRLKWEWKDLQPYVRDLKVPDLTSEALLLKYTRRSQPTADAEPVLRFGPKRTKHTAFGQYSTSGEAGTFNLNASMDESVGTQHPHEPTHPIGHKAAKRKGKRKAKADDDIARNSSMDEMTKVMLIKEYRKYATMNLSNMNEMQTRQHAALVAIIEKKLGI